MSNRHKHADMINAKAENMDLVVFTKFLDQWCQLGDMDFPEEETGEYFLCLPQHKETCLHWLNAGSVQTNRASSDLGWDNLLEFDGVWSKVSHFMCVDILLRIKPLKQKRWIAVNSDGYVMPVHYGSKESAIEYVKNCNILISETQFIEIEVEV